MARKIIFFELNEVPWRVIDSFCDANPTSCIARMLPRSRQMTTLAADTRPLHPWCTWPTIHRGVPNDVHGIDHFGQELQNLDRTYPPIWQLLQQADLEVGVFGSLHTYPLPSDPEAYAFFVPDTFAKSAECHPAQASVFQRFNLSMARASSRNVSSAIDLPAAAVFVARAPMLGVRPTTLAAVVAQLLRERREPHLRVRRRSYQSVLAFDLFDKLLRKTRPDFCTFFTNHVASSQHRYWAARFPEDYAELGFDADWIARWSGEIDFSMELADRMLRRLVGFVDANDEFVLIVTSSMGQSAHDSQPIRTQLYLRDIPRFMRTGGIPDAAWEQLPAMDPDVALRIDEAYADRFQQFVENITLSEKSIYSEQKEAGFFNVAFGQRNQDANVDLRVAGVPTTIDELGLRNEEIDDQAASSGNHMPEGCLLIYDRMQADPDRNRSAISTLELAPFILGHFGVDRPDYMVDPSSIAPI